MIRESSGASALKHFQGSPGGARAISTRRPVRTARALRATQLPRRPRAGCPCLRWQNDCVSGKQVKLFLVDGTPGGLTTAEITNWTGHVLSARRSDLSDLLEREEAQRTGVYLLLGDERSRSGIVSCS